MGSPSYLIRNQYSYCFRLHVPSDLQVYIGKKELRYSLRTGYLGLAKSKARLYAGDFQLLFRTIREVKMSGELSDTDIKWFVNLWVSSLLESYERMKIGINPSTEEGRERLATFKDLVFSQLKSAKRDMAENEHYNMAGTVRPILEKVGLPDVKYGSYEYRKLGRESLIKYIQALEIEVRRINGDYSDDVSALFPFQPRGKKRSDLPPNAELESDLMDILDETRSFQKQIGIPAHDHGTVIDSTVGIAPSHNSAPAAPASPVVTLAEVLDEYWKRKEVNWSGAAYESYERYTRRLLQHFGEDKPIDTIDYKAMEQFRDELKATGNKGKPIAIKTVNLHLEFYSGLFNHAIQSRRISHNPVSGVKFPDKRRKQGLNDPFPKEDLIKLFHSDRYKNDTFGKGWMFWLPILSLYTGARIEELCQLYIDDIITVEGIPVLDIDEKRPDQKVKDHEKRYIPLHPFLTDELRIVEYAHGLQDQDGRLFPELKRIGTKSKRKGGKDRLRYSHYPSTNWFPKYKRKECGVVAQKFKKTIHSFRHNVSYCLMKQSVQEYVIAMFMGHEHDQISTGRYGQRFEVDELMENAVLKLDYGIDLSHLKNSRFVPKK